MADLDFKVYTEKGEYIAALKHASDAAAVVALYSKGKIKYAGRVVWTEGKEAQSAAHSYDYAAQVMFTRIREHQQQHLAKQISKTKFDVII